jgi:DNA-directed RNA polymerase specialized sigma24 family protein
MGFRKVTLPSAETVRNRKSWPLTRGYREVFELYAFEGYDYHEIATQLSVPVGTVKSRLARARRELRRRLALGV